MGRFFKSSNAAPSLRPQQFFSSNPRGSSEKLFWSNAVILVLTRFCQFFQIFLWTLTLSGFLVTPPIPDPSCYCSVSQLCPTLFDPMDCSTPAFPVLHHLPEFSQTLIHWVADAIQPSHHPLSPLLLPPSIFPSIRVFSNELTLPIMWPKYWSFSYSISPSSEYSGLISLRIDWFDLLAV